MARAIPSDFRGTVATNSLLVAIELSNHPNVVVHAAGGRLRGGDMALSNSNAQNFFRDLHGLITDSEPPATIREALEKSGGVTIIA